MYGIGIGQGGIGCIGYIGYILRFGVGGAGFRPQGSESIVPLK